MNVLNCCDPWKAGQPLAQIQVYYVVVHAKHSLPAVLVAFLTGYSTLEDQACITCSGSDIKAPRSMKDPQV
jgi:hypothetical protein